MSSTPYNRGGSGRPIPSIITERRFIHFDDATVLPRHSYKSDVDSLPDRSAGGRSAGPWWTRAKLSSATSIRYPAKVPIRVPTPAHEVVASLGALPEQAIENLRRALKASRNGEAVVLPSETKTEHCDLPFESQCGELSHRPL